MHSMHALHFDRRRLRRTAWAALLVWLFALAAGVVNACVLTSPGLADRGEPLTDVALHESLDDPGALVGQPGHEQDSGRASCLKFCDDESSAIAKVKWPAVDPGSGLAIVVAPWNWVAATSGASLRLATEQHGSQGPPLVIRFLRLTL